MRRSCKFRHLIEEKELGKQIFAAVNEHHKAQGIKVSNGTIVDTTIITAPCTTKNKDKERDLKMHQIKKDNQWYIGMTGHIGVNSKEKMIHSVDLCRPMCMIATRPEVFLTAMKLGYVVTALTKVRKQRSGRLLLMPRM